MTETLHLPASKVPPDLTEQEEHLSNLDGRIDVGCEEKLRKGRTYARHAAWDFCGYVWFKDGMFIEEVWVYGSVADTHSASDLRKLMNEVNAEHGWK